jgi:hypothetical protein
MCCVERLNPQPRADIGELRNRYTVPGIRVIDARRELSGKCLLCIFDTTGRPVKFDLYSLRQRKRSLTGTIRRLVSLEDPQQDEGRGVDPVARRGSAPAGLEKGVQRLCVSRLARKSHGQTLVPARSASTC